MLFKQRKKIDFISKIFSYFWPKNGWGRLFKYTTLRIKRLPGSPHSIALGFTFGIAAAQKIQTESKKNRRLECEYMENISL